MEARTQHAASFVKDLVQVAREVAAWRRERDAFVAMYKIESARRESRPSDAP
jgi:hypothetical protein